MSSADSLDPVFLSLADVLLIHSRMIELYGGSSGVRDTGLLESALAQPCAKFGGQFLHEDIFVMAAAYVFHIAMNHPFIDGNKRTALASALTFLDLNGIEIEEEGVELADMVLEMIEQHRDKQWVARQLASRESADSLKEFEAMWTHDRTNYALLKVPQHAGGGYLPYDLKNRVAVIIEDDQVSAAVAHRMLAAGVLVYGDPDDVPLAE